MPDYTNCTIGFFPKRKLTDPAPPTDVLYEIEVALTAFDLEVRDRKVENETMGGNYNAILYFAAETYNCTLNWYSSTATREEIEMFLYSTMGGEVFYITNLDESDANMTVKQLGRFSRTREDSSDVGQFNYSFTVRNQEVIS